GQEVRVEEDRRVALLADALNRTAVVVEKALEVALLLLFWIPDAVELETADHAPQELGYGEEIRVPPLGQRVRSRREDLRHGIGAAAERERVARLDAHALEVLREDRHLAAGGDEYAPSSEHRAPLPLSVRLHEIGVRGPLGLPIHEVE